MGFKVRENNKGKYVIVNAEEFDEGVDFILSEKCEGMQLRSSSVSDSHILDVKKIEKLKMVLKNLSISGIKKIKNQESFYSLMSLNNLVIGDKIDLKLDVSKFNDLESLGIFHSKGITGYASNISLKKLTISSNYPFGNLEEFKGCSNIETLSLYKSKINSVDFIGEMSGLRELNLSYNSRLDDVSGINLSKSLRKIHIEKNKVLSDFKGLEGNSNIEELFISDLDSLVFVKNMRNLKSINFLNCIDGNLNPLIESESLEDIYFYPDKKHYTHSLAEIRKHKN